MTKFEVFEDKVSDRRMEKRNAVYNEMILTSLTTKTHDEVVQEMLQGLTVVLGVGDLQTAKTFAL